MKYENNNDARINPDNANAHIKKLQEEVVDQCLMNGISAQRELTLMSRVSALRTAFESILAGEEAPYIIARAALDYDDERAK